MRNPLQQGCDKQTDNVEERGKYPEPICIKLGPDYEAELKINQEEFPWWRELVEQQEGQLLVPATLSNSSN